MLLILGVFIIIATLIFVCVAAWHKRMTATGIGTLAFVGVAVGIVIANISDIVGLVLKSGDKTSYSLQLEKRVEKKAQEVETDATEVRQMKEQIQAIVERLEKGEQATQEASKKLSSMEQQQKQRRLSDEQRKILIAALSPLRGQKMRIDCIMGDDESRQFAEDLEDVFIRASLDFAGVNTSLYTLNPIGLRVDVNEGEGKAGRFPENAETVIDALIQAGLLNNRAVTGNAHIPIGVIQLTIGRKPPVPPS